MLTAAVLLPAHPKDYLQQNLLFTVQRSQNWPLPESNATPNTALITLTAGDDGINAASLERASQLLRNRCIPTLLSTLDALPLYHTKITLYSGTAGYSDAASNSFPPQEIQSVIAKTSGFTLNDDIYIPLYQYRNSDALLANTLSHELTHVTINDRGLENTLPQWFNEGLAWYEGTAAEEQIDPAAVRQMNEELGEQVRDADNDGTLKPLDDDGDLLSDNLSYNVEFRDYLAVRHMVHVSGDEVIKAVFSKTQILQKSQGN